MKRKSKKAGILSLIILLAGGMSIGARGWNVHQEERARAAEIKEASEHIEKLGVDLELRYYYQKLGEDEKESYRVIVDGIRREKEKITVPLSDAEQVNRIYQEVMMDFPEFFWCSGKVRTTAYTGRSSYSEVAPDYLYPRTKMGSRKKKIEAVADKIVDGIDKDSSDYEKIKYIYEYIINTTDYNPSAEDNQNIYSVLIGKESVCAGYAKSMQYLMNRMGMFCAYVVGTTNSSEYHAWNLVKCDGEYYYVDATWGDPVFAQKTEGINDDNITYDYLCCSDAELFRTHQTDDAYEYPACTSEKLNYYRMNHMYYTSYDAQKACKVMKKSIDRQDEETIFKYADEETYRKAEKSLIQNGLISEAARYLCEKYSLNRVNYYYQKDEDLHKITLFWRYSE